MKKVFILTAIFLFSFTAMYAQGGKPAPKEKSLYQRLGGYDAIAGVSDDFIGRLATGKLLSRFVVGLSVDSQKKLRQHLVDFLCSATGGPCLYLGRDMKTVHTGLPSLSGFPCCCHQMHPSRGHLPHLHLNLHLGVCGEPAQAITEFALLLGRGRAAAGGRD